MKNAISWFEIPVADLDRAKKFYETILDIEMPVMQMDDQGSKWAFFPFDMENGGVGGAIMKAEGYEPGANGPVIYLNGGDDLGIPLNKVEGAGGKVIMLKTSIGENGFMGVFIDTEGNRVAFHSRT